MAPGTRSFLLWGRSRSNIRSYFLSVNLVLRFPLMLNFILVFPPSNHLREPAFPPDHWLYLGSCLVRHHSRSRKSPRTPTDSGQLVLALAKSGSFQFVYPIRRYRKTLIFCLRLVQILKSMSRSLYFPLRLPTPLSPLVSSR